MQVEYIEKETQKKMTTKYITIQPHDKKYLMDKLRELSEIAAGCLASDDQSYKTIGMRLSVPQAQLPRRSNREGGGMNSIKSACDGIIANIEDGTQRDFSIKTMDLITKAFASAANIFTDWDRVEFVKVSEFSKAKPIVTGLPLDSNLFEPITFEVTVKRVR